MKKILMFLCAVLLFAACEPKQDKMFKQAVELAKQGQDQAALRVYNNLLREFPYYYPALANRAIIYEKNKQTLMAEEDYLKALEIKPDQPEILNNLGAFYMSQGKPFQALYQLNRAVQVDPNYFTALLTRASINESLEYLDLAAEDLQKAVNLKPENVLALTNKAIVDYKRLFFEDAIQGYTKALYYSPNDAKNLYRRGMAFKKAGKMANALHDLSLALTFQTDYVGALYARADVLLKSGDYQAAMVDLETLKSINNRYVAAYELAGDIFAAADPKSAIANYTIAKKLDPENRKRYDSKIAAMRTVNGRLRVFESTVLKY